MTDEQVVIVDRDNKVTGVASRQTMRQDTLLHRSSYVMVEDGHGGLFVQQRTMTKDLFPGLYEPGCAGVVGAHESYEQAARRELAEELGISKVVPRFCFDFFLESSVNRVWGRVFSCVWPGPLRLQQEEVAWGEFMSWQHCQKLAAQGKMTPDGALILARLVPFLHHIPEARYE